MFFTESLKKTEQFSNVYKKGKYKADNLLIIKIIENNLGINRLGISVSKKVGNSVVRHRIKRRIKESYRLNEKIYKSGYDIVFISKKESNIASFHNVNKSVIKLSKKVNILLD